MYRMTDQTNIIHVRVTLRLHTHRVKDAGFAEHHHASGDGFFKRTGKALSFDQMIFNVFRDWTQVMSLTLSKLSPQVPAFTSGVGLIFALTSLDFSALLKALNVDIAGGFSGGILAIAFVLFLVFQYFWWTGTHSQKLLCHYLNKPCMLGMYAYSPPGQDTYQTNTRETSF